MWKCPYCGKENEDGLICTGCGRSISLYGELDFDEFLPDVQDEIIDRFTDFLEGEDDEETTTGNQGPAQNES